MGDAADQRSVSTDALATLGRFIDDTQKRDAIHLAVEPVVAGEALKPGDHIYIREGIATKKPTGAGMGIVDPFLMRGPKKGERFWFIMYPRQVRSLRHVWSHPAFRDEDGTTPDGAIQVFDGDGSKSTPLRKTTVTGAVKTIEAILEDIGGDLEYSAIMSAAESWLDSEDYLTQHGSETWRDRFPQHANAFWTAYQIVTGKDVPADKRESFFSCSC